MENKSKVLIFGALSGAITGVLAAWLLTRHAGKGQRSTTLTVQEGLKLGLLVLGLLRAIASLRDEK